MKNTMLQSKHRVSYSVWIFVLFLGLLSAQKVRADAFSKECQDASLQYSKTCDNLPSNSPNYDKCQKMILEMVDICQGTVKKQKPHKLMKVSAKCKTILNKKCADYRKTPTEETFQKCMGQADQATINSCTQ